MRKVYGSIKSKGKSEKQKVRIKRNNQISIIPAQLNNHRLFD